MRKFLEVKIASGFGVDSKKRICGFSVWCGSSTLESTESLEFTEVLEFTEALKFTEAPPMNRGKTPAKREFGAAPLLRFGGPLQTSHPPPIKPRKPCYEIGKALL